MKTVYFIRHAKSSWDKPVIDKERSLNERGYYDAQLMAEVLKNRTLTVDKVFCSTAKRTETTCSIITYAIGIKEENIIYTEDLYDFDGRGILKFIKSLPENLNSVLMFGHNPAFTGIINIFGDQSIENLPTCGVVGITFNINSWLDFAEGKTILKLAPKDFK